MRVLFSGALCIALGVGCGKSPTSSSDTAAASTNACAGIGAGTMSATLDGSSWSPSPCDVSAIRTSTTNTSFEFGQVSFWGSTYPGVSPANPGGSPTIVDCTVLSGSPGVTTYTVNGTGHHLICGVWMGGKRWNTDTIPPSAGLLTFTTLTSTQAIGTFNFVALPDPSTPGATGTKTVTNGVFNVKF